MPIRFRCALGRVNQVEDLLGWPMRLHWAGFEVADKPPTDEQLIELKQTLATLLRRFVDLGLNGPAMDARTIKPRR